MTIETANRLYELRKKHGLSQEELAERLGVSRQAISKWERSEASPDTDNLIALAKLYGLSLDDLIYGEKKTDDNKKEETAKERITSDDTPLFIDVEDGNNKVKIGPAGIFVEDEDGETVRIGLNGIKIHGSKSSNDDDDDYEVHGVTVENDGNIKVNIDNSHKKKTRFWLELPYPIICVVAYLLFGFLNICGGWALSWIVFITIPIYYSFVEAIYKRRFSEFEYPVFTAFAYLFIGLYLKNWHPSWIIFLTIPIYYPIANAIDTRIRLRNTETNNKG